MDFYASVCKACGWGSSAFVTSVTCVEVYHVEDLAMWNCVTLSVKLEGSGRLFTVPVLDCLLRERYDNELYSENLFRESGTYGRL